MPTSNSTNFAMNGLQLMESALRLSRQLGIRHPRTAQYQAEPQHHDAALGKLRRPHLGH